MVQQAKSVLTTGEVAKICSVAPRTVSKWFDAGKLRGYRIPGSKDRRIPLDQLIRFMRAHGIPLNGLDAGETRVVILDADMAFCDTLKTALELAHGYQVQSAASAFEAGALVQEVTPHVLLVDVDLPDVDPHAIVRWVRSTPDLQALRLVGIGHGLAPGKGQALLQDGFDGYLAKPFSVEAFRSLVEPPSCVSLPPQSVPLPAGPQAL